MTHLAVCKVAQHCGGERFDVIRVQRLGVVLVIRIIIVTFGPGGMVYELDSSAACFVLDLMTESDVGDPEVGRWDNDRWITGRDYDTPVEICFTRREKISYR